MKIILSNDKLTRFAKSGDYATTTDIVLEGDISTTAQILIAWLQTQLSEGETVSQVMIEPDGFVGDMDEEGNAIWTRLRLSAAVTVASQLGSRTFAISSESLPPELRDGLLASWDLVAAIPVNLGGEINEDGQNEPDPQPPQSDPEV